MTKKPLLVPNWKKLGRSWTIILAVIFALANILMGGLFMLTPILDVQTMGIINFTCFVIVGIGRVLRQAGLQTFDAPDYVTRQDYAQTKEEEDKASRFDNPDA